MPIACVQDRSWRNLVEELEARTHMCEPTAGKRWAEFDWMPEWVDQTGSAWLVGWNSCKRAVHPYALQASTEGWINNTTCTYMCDYFSNHQCCYHEWNTDSLKSDPARRPPLGYCALSQTAGLIKTTAVYREIKCYLGSFLKYSREKRQGVDETRRREC